MPATDPKTLREQALFETSRFFQEKYGTTPAGESEEWEEEYRRQFDRLKSGAEPNVSAASSPSVVAEAKRGDLPEPTGAPADTRWAVALRSARLKQIQNSDLRSWLTKTSVSAKERIDTRDLSAEAFLRRVEPRSEDARRRSAAAAATAAAVREAHVAATSALQAEITAAGVSAAGLIDLIDISPRVAAVAINEKLAEVHHEGRTLRVFETANPAVLMVLEKHGNQRNDYGIEWDEGLVAGPRLFARAAL